MASLTRHRVRAVVSCVLDGVLVGGAEAALELPARSRQRATAYGVLLTVTAVDALAPELPQLRRAFHGLTPDPTPPADRTAVLRSGLVCGAVGLAATVVRGPAVQALRARGSRRPHLVLGLLTGLATALGTLPVWWDRAAARAAADEASEALDRELEELLAGSGR